MFTFSFRTLATAAGKTGRSSLSAAPTSSAWSRAVQVSRAQERRFSVRKGNVHVQLCFTPGEQMQWGVPPAAGWGPVDEGFKVRPGKWRVERPIKSPRTINLGPLKTAGDASRLQTAIDKLAGVDFDPRSVEGYNCVHALARVVHACFEWAPELTLGGYVSGDAYMNMLEAAALDQGLKPEAEEPAEPATTSAMPGTDDNPGSERRPAPATDQPAS
jgi:hypothetical protein